MSSPYDLQNIHRSLNKHKSRGRGDPREKVRGLSPYPPPSLWRKNKMRMSRAEVEHEINHADTDPRIRKELSEIIVEINDYVPGDKTKSMMYDLVHVVVGMDERIRQLERRVCGGSPQDELRRQQDVLNGQKPYFPPSD